MKRFPFFSLLFLALACGGGGETPLSERLRKVWTVQTAKHDGTLVYTKGGANNLEGRYASFRLDLSNAQSQTVTLTEVDGTVFTGTWALSADNKKLTLNGLNPQPTGTNGTVELVIEGEVTNARLVLNRSTASLKTGGTLNRYELTSP